MRGSECHVTRFKGDFSLDQKAGKCSVVVNLIWRWAMNAGTAKRVHVRMTSVDTSVLTQIRMPDGRIVERVNKDIIAEALNAAGRKPSHSTEESKRKG